MAKGDVHGKRGIRLLLNVCLVMKENMALPCKYNDLFRGEFIQ